MLAKTIFVSALTTVDSAAVIARTGGGDERTESTSEFCPTRNERNTSPKYCLNLNGISTTIPAYARFYLCLSLVRLLSHSPQHSYQPLLLMAYHFHPDDEIDHILRHIDEKLRVQAYDADPSYQITHYRST